MTIRDFKVTMYEWRGETRYDIGSQAFLTGVEALQLARNILTKVRTVEMMRTRREHGEVKGGGNEQT